MKIGLMNRSELADIFSTDKKDMLAPYETFSSLNEIVDYNLKDECAFVVLSPSETDLLPVCIVVGNSKVRDWLAWLVTFAPSLRPFTAYCRVIDQSELKMIISQSSGETFPMGLLGMVIGEAITAEGPRLKTQSLPHPVSMYATTLSYSLARGAYISPGIDFGIISDKWTSTRKLTEQRERTISADEIIKISKILLKAAGLNTSQNYAIDSAISVCSELASHGSEKALHAFSTYDYLSSFDINMMTGTRGDRVKTFEKAVGQIKNNKRDFDGNEDFIVGFLASMIAPGSLAHIGLIMRDLEHFPLSAIWYAACASIGDRRKFLSEMEGIGRRIFRDLVSKFDFRNQPTCDLAFSELEIYLDARMQYRDFLISVPNYLSVELTPGTETFVSWRSLRKIDSPIPRRDDHELKRIADEAYLMSGQLRSFAHRLSDASRKLPQQKGLFDNEQSGVSKIPKRKKKIK